MSICNESLLTTIVQCIMSNFKLPIGYIQEYSRLSKWKINTIILADDSPFPEGFIPCDGKDITDLPDMTALVKTLREAGVTGRICLPNLPSAIIKYK